MSDFKNIRFIGFPKIVFVFILKVLEFIIISLYPSFVIFIAASYVPSGINNPIFEDYDFD